MSDISINKGNTENAVAEIVNRVRSEIMEAGQVSADRIAGAVGHSAGDFILSLQNEAAQEAAVMHSVGELLIAMAEYIQSASDAFANVDTTYNTSKV